MLAAVSISTYVMLEYYSTAECFVQQLKDQPIYHIKITQMVYTVHEIESWMVIFEMWNTKGERELKQQKMSD